MCDCNNYSGCVDHLENKNSYYIETSLGKIPFISKDVENIRIKSRKINEYQNFIPTSNVKFLKFADKYGARYIMEYNIYSEKTKNGVFLKLATDEFIAEYKIFKVND